MLSTKSGFAAVAAAVAISTLAPSMAGAQNKGGGKAAPAMQGIVVDANGKTIGPFFPSLGGAPLVLTTANGRGVLLLLSPYFDGPTPTQLVSTKLAPAGGPADFYFTGAGCSGTPYLASGTASGLHPSAVVSDSPGGTLYVGSDDLLNRTFLVASYRQGTGACNNLTQPTAINNLAPIVDAIQLSTLFAQPYSVK